MGKLMQKRTYLDYAASTPIDKRVSKAMEKVAETAWANPSSLHIEGMAAREILEKSRTEIANILNCRASEVYFTSGGTESANIAISGIIQNAKSRLNLDKSNQGLTLMSHIITSTIEHPAVLETINSLSKWGVEVSYISPNENGIVSAESINKEIKENTVLICLMHANNEIGVIQPVAKVANFIKEYKKNKKLDRREPLLPYPYLLTDASQSAAYENIALDRLGADLLILDGIKIYGPRGAGILVIKQGVGISSTIFGGGQEKGMRPGTENVISALGLAEAVKIANKIREKESSRLTQLRDYAITKILKEVPGSSLNGDPERRLPNNINICFSPQGNALGKVDSEFLVIKLDTLGFAVSSASACSNLKTENSSYVLEALGKGPSAGSGSSNCASSSLRFTLGRETTKADLDKLIFALKKVTK